MKGFKNLDHFFGFVKCKVTISKDVLKPILPYKYKGKTIFPTGNWEGVYFSEEVKAASKLKGYSFTYHEGYEFSTYPSFLKYVNTFYLLASQATKKKSTGAERFIAKMHLNSLYGIMGRKKEDSEASKVYLFTKIN